MPADPKARPIRVPYDEWYHWNRKYIVRDHALPAPAEGIFDYPYACLKINLAWASHVIGAISALMQPDSWTGDDDEQHRALQEVEKLIGLMAAMCSGGDGLILRQNPANACQLQQSIDGGDTWTLAFDYSLCQSVPTQTQVSNYYTTNITNLQQIFQNFTDNYVDNITDLHEDLGYDETAEDDYRDQALCFAANEFIKYVSESAINALQELETSLNNVKLAVAIAAALAGLVGLATTGGATSPALAALAADAALWAAGLGLGAVVGEAIYNHLIDSAVENYQNEAARQEVACCLYNALKGANVNLDVFKTGLSGCTFEGDAAKIAGYAQILLQQDVTYATFVETLELAYRQARVDILPDCPCDDDVFAVFANIDVPGNDTGFDVVSGTDYALSPSGIWNGGTGNVDARGSLGSINGSAIMPTANIYRLVYRVGTSGAWLATDDTFIFTAASSGRLYLACNDVTGAYTDNSGSITVTIEAV